jgi:hypothetical protein
MRQITTAGIFGAVALLVACGNDGSPGDGGGGGETSAGAGQSGAAQNGGSGGKAGGGGSSKAGAGGAGGRGVAGSNSAGKAGAPSNGGSAGSAGSGGSGGGPVNTAGAPSAGNPDGKCAIPAEAKSEDTSNPKTVVGTGTPASCTGDAVVAAVAQGGVITFDCGPDPVTITMNRTAKVVNDTGPKIVIDGGGLVTLDGGGSVRILYQNACDENQKFTTSHCDNQDHPQLTVQNLTFVNGNSDGETFDGGGGGAIFVRGGRFKVLNSRFFGNRCDSAGQDLGGAAIRVRDQFEGQQVYIVNSTFGAEGRGNICSNGGGLSSIGVSYTVINSLFSHNDAIGVGANPARANTPGGGSGGAIYNDGTTYTLSLCGTRIENNHANEGGGAIFFVSNDRTGTLRIQDSVLSDNPSDGFETDGFPGIFVLANGNPQVLDSILE